MPQSLRFDYYTRPTALTLTKPSAPRQTNSAVAAPEQLRGEAVTPAFDIYGLGVVAHRLLLGHLPSEPAPDHFVAAPMPEELSLLIARMLDADPTRRPRDDELAAALDTTARKLREGAPAQHARVRPDQGEADSNVPLGLSRSAPWLRLLVAALALTATLFALFGPVLDSADTSAPPKKPQTAVTPT